MRKLIKKFALVATVVLMLASHAALAQKGSVAAGVAFDFDRANLVAGCNCFGLYGGSATTHFGVTNHIALLGSVAGVRQSGLTPDGYALTETTYMGGVRVFPLARPGKLKLFGDAEFGLAHAGGSLSPAKTGYGSANAFATQFGGGVELRLSRHWLLVPAEADYLLTTFSNAGSNRQNQLRVSAGVLYRWKE